MAEYGPEWTASVRAKIMDQIKAIQPKAGKNLKDVAIPTSVYKLANSISKTSEARDKFSKVPVYDILLKDLQQREHVTLDKANTVLEGWKIACNSLFRYALNLILAPIRVEFKKMKLSSSFYVYNISHNLHHAERVLIHMGYRPADKKERKESQDLVYDGDVKTELVLETATDLLVMHEEIVHLQENVSFLIRCGRSSCTLQQVFNRNKLDVPRDPHWAPPTGSPRSSSSHLSHDHLPPPPVLFTGETAIDHEHVHQQVLGAGAGGQYGDDVNAGEMQVGGNPQIATSTTTAPSSQVPPTSQGYVNLNFGSVTVAPSIVPASQRQAIPGNNDRFSAHAVQPPVGGSNSDMYANLAPLQQNNLQPTAGPVRQLSYQEGPVGTTENNQVARRTSSPNVAATSNYPPTSSTATGWDGVPAANATIYQNFQNMFNYPGEVQHIEGTTSSSEPPSPSTYRGSHPAQVPVHSTPRIPPVPKSRTRRPTPSNEAQQVVVEGFQEKNVREAVLKAQQAVSGEALGLEQENVHATYLKGHLQRKPPSTDSIAENLPPPITDFTSPSTGDTYFESGIRSGLLSGFHRGIDSGPSLCLNDPDSSSGPIGLGERTISDSNSSGYSTDIYGSGPGFVRQQSSVTPLEALDEEELERGGVGGGERQEEGDNGLEMSMDSRPQPASSSNITTEGRRRLFEHADSTGRQNSLSKSMSVDEGENSNPRQERSSPQLRSTKSGTNLGEFEKQQQQQSENEKPPLSPRISRLAPSSPSARQFSPTASPRSGHRNRPPAHENWVPTKGVAGVTLVPVAEETSKSNTLPRQAKSVDVDPLPRREVSRFSSGSNLLQNSGSVPGHKHLDLREPQQSQSRENYEPETPVVGIIPSHLQKKFGLGEQGAPGLQPLQQHTATSDKQNEANIEARAWGKEQQQEHPANSTKQPNFPWEPVGFLESRELPGDVHAAQSEKPQYARSQTCGKDELKQKLEQAQQKELSTQKQLKEKYENEKKLQQQLDQEKQEKDVIQKKLRDLELQLQLQKQERKHATIPMLTTSKSVAIVSPTTAEGKPTSSKDEDESCLDYPGGGGGGARALKKMANQAYPGQEPQRDRAYANSGKQRPKRSSEQKTDFSTTSPDYRDDNNTPTSIPGDMTTHLDLENTWVCEYCTNLNSDALTQCEVCNRLDPRKCWTCVSCNEINPTSLSNCHKCKKMRVTTV